MLKPVIEGKGSWGAIFLKPEKLILFSGSSSP
jgi:hypothetical protein